MELFLQKEHSLLNGAGEALILVDCVKNSDVLNLKVANSFSLINYERMDKSCDHHSGFNHCWSLYSRILFPLPIMYSGI